MLFLSHVFSSVSSYDRVFGSFPFSLVGQIQIRSCHFSYLLFSDLCVSLAFRFLSCSCRHVVLRLVFFSMVIIRNCPALLLFRRFISGGLARIQIVDKWLFDAEFILPSWDVRWC